MPLGIVGAVVGGLATSSIAGAALGMGVGSLAAGVLGMGPGGGGGGGSASAEQQTIFGEQQNYEKQLEKLIADPSSVSSLPGYKFQMEQGTQAVARQMAGSGYLGSGNEAIALTQYGQGLAQNFYQTQTSLLAQLAGITSPSSPAQLGAVGTQQQSNQWNQMFQAMAGIGSLAGKFGSAGTPTSTSGTIAPGAAYGGQGVGWGPAWTSWAPSNAANTPITGN